MGFQVHCGDCVQLASKLDDKSVRLVACSPPYAMQRKATYGGILEKDYPEWTVQWMKSLLPKITDDASIFIVIREHIKDGQISDYVLRTRLAVRENGWIEAEHLIWHKPDAPPLGSVMRPRRTWESILWFTQTKNPFSDLKACGNPDSERIGSFAGSERFGEGGDSPIHMGQNRGSFQKGTSRCSDLIQINISSMDRGVDHPAMYPRGVAEFIIKTYSEVDDLVLDPFCGSGQTGLAALDLKRNFVGFELKKEYVDLTKKRMSSAQV